jgi:hypothetical protein
MTTITKLCSTLLNLALKEKREVVLNECSITPNKRTLPKDVFHHLRDVANSAKTIKNPTLCQSIFRGDPLVDNKPSKYAQLIR